MTKIVIREIKRCNQCPYLKVLRDEYCLHGDKPKKLDTTQWIPSWCPLPDKEENGFIKWLSTAIKEMEEKNLNTVMTTPSHDYHQRIGFLAALNMVEDKVKELGLNNKQTGYD